MRKILAMLFVGFFGIASIGCADDESYTMWVSIKSSYTTKTNWKKLHKFHSLSNCEECLRGNRDMFINTMKEQLEEEIIRIVRHRDNAYTVYGRTFSGTETEYWEQYWEFQCYPSSFDPRK
jgi:hypothetical protein